MRPIKFRAANLATKQVCRVLSIDFLNQDVLVIVDEARANKEVWKLSASMLLQFTGLLDKSGREIYEGDILCWPQYEGTKMQGRWVVEWNERNAAFESWLPRDKAEVIGSTYENPELLGGEDA